MQMTKMYFNLFLKFGIFFLLIIITRWVVVWLKCIIKIFLALTKDVVKRIICWIHTQHRFIDLGTVHTYPPFSKKKNTRIHT